MKTVAATIITSVLGALALSIALSLTADAQSTSVKVWNGVRTAQVMDTGSNDSLACAIVDGSGTQITSFGGGSQYTEGGTEASITAPALMWRDVGDVMTPVAEDSPLPVEIKNASLPLPTGAATEATLLDVLAELVAIAVDAASLDGKVTACNTGAVAGTVTCNAGTDLNTSALATSANQTTELGYLDGVETILTAIQTAVQIIDDWDESDRAKVNPIVGQAGVAGGAGNTSALTQRVVAAADVGEPLSTNYGTIYQGTTALTVKRAIVAESSSGDNLVVAGVTSKKIVVLSARVMASAAVDVKWRSNTTDIDGLAYLIDKGGYVLPLNPAGWYVTAAGEALNLNLSGAVPVGGIVQYVEAD